MRYILALIVSLTIVVPVFGREVEELSLREAVQRAMAHSEQFRRQGESARLNELRAIQSRYDLLMAYNPDMSLAEALRVMQNDITRIFDIADRYIQIDMLEHSLKSLYTAIQNAEADLIFYDTGLEIMERRLRIERVRHENGLISDQDWQDFQREHHQQQLGRAALETTLEEAYEALARMLHTARRTDGVRYSIVFGLDFTPLGGRTLGGFVEAAVAGNSHLRREARELEVRRFESQRSPLDTELQRQERRLQLDWAARDLRINQDAVRDTATALYRELQNLEVNRTIQQEQLASLAAQLSLGSYMVEIGRMTQLDLDQLHLDHDRAQEALRRTEAAHALTLVRLSNPNLL